MLHLQPSCTFHLQEMACIALMTACGPSSAGYDIVNVRLSFLISFVACLNICVGLEHTVLPVSFSSTGSLGYDGNEEQPISLHDASQIESTACLFCVSEGSTAHTVTMCPIVQYPSSGFSSSEQAS